MMADNLHAIVAQEQRRGPSLVLAHNALLRRARSGEDDVNWVSAGVLIALTLGERYVFLAIDASPTAIQAPSRECRPRRPRAAPCARHKACAPHYPVHQHRQTIA